MCNCFGHIERIEFSNPASTPRGARAVRAGEIRRQRLERHGARLERQLHAWLDEHGYQYDVVSDLDVHRDPGVLHRYRQRLTAKG